MGAPACQARAALRDRSSRAGPGSTDPELPSHLVNCRLSVGTTSLHPVSGNHSQARACRPTPTCVPALAPLSGRRRARKSILPPRGAPVKGFSLRFAAGNPTLAGVQAIGAGEPHRTRVTCPLASPVTRLLPLFVPAELLRARRLHRSRKNAILVLVPGTARISISGSGR